MAVRSDSSDDWQRNRKMNRRGKRFSSRGCGVRAGLTALAVASTFSLSWLGGCFPPSVTFSNIDPQSLPDPAGEVFSHCRELLCTAAELPNCEFRAMHHAVGGYVEEDRYRCARAGEYVACEQRAALVGGGQEYVAKFRCKGDPVRCEMSGGDPRLMSWYATLLKSADESRFSCKG